MRNPSPGRPGQLGASALLFLFVTACASSGTPSATATRTQRGTVAIAGTAGPNMVVDTHRELNQTERVIAGTSEEIWGVLRDAFGSLDVEVTEVDPRQRIMGNPRFRPRRVDGDRLSTFIDCGRDHGGPYADQHEVWLTFMAQLLPAPNGETRLVTLVTATAEPRAVTAAALPCQSNGELEGRLVTAVVSALTGDAPE